MDKIDTIHSGFGRLAPGDQPGKLQQDDKPHSAGIASSALGCLRRVAVFSILFCAICATLLAGATESLAARGVRAAILVNMKFCTAVAVTMGFGPSFASEVAAALTGRRPSVVYLHAAECTGCSEALLRTYKPFIDAVILDTISLDYHKTIMRAPTWNKKE